MNSSIEWPDKSLPVPIRCAAGVLTGLELVAIDGLLAMPRIGLGVGGLLLGRRRDGGIEILRTVPIPCSHALGPSFMLTPAERSALVALPEPEGDPADDADRQVVGWYCSKTHGPPELTEHDHVLFDAFCPESWQVLLLIRPAKGKPTQAVFGLRGTGESGRTFSPGEWMDLAWRELAAFQTPAPKPEIPAETRQETRPETRPEIRVAEAGPPPVREEPVMIATLAEAPLVVPPAAIPVEMPNAGTLFGDPRPRLKLESRRQSSSSGPLRTNLLIAALALLVLAMIGLLIRGMVGG